MIKCPCCKHESQDKYGEDFQHIYCKVLSEDIAITTPYSYESAVKCPKCGVLFIPPREG